MRIIRLSVVITRVWRRSCTRVRYSFSFVLPLVSNERSCSGRLCRTGRHARKHVVRSRVRTRYERLVPHKLNSSLYMRCLSTQQTSEIPHPTPKAPSAKVQASHGTASPANSSTRRVETQHRTVTGGTLFSLYFVLVHTTSIYSLQIYYNFAFFLGGKNQWTRIPDLRF